MGLGSFFGGVATGLLGMEGAKDTNQANERIASARNLFEQEEAVKARGFSHNQALLARRFSSDQAKKQMDYQTQMSSTAVQRRMEDMKAAGINPILAGKFDASTPAGAMAQATAPATSKANSQGYTAINTMQPLLDNLGNAIQLRKLNAEAKKTEQEAKLTGNKVGMTSPASTVASDADYVYKNIKNMMQDKGFHQYLKKSFMDSVSSGYNSTAKALGRASDKISDTIGNIISKDKTKPYKDKDGLHIPIYPK